MNLLTDKLTHSYKGIKLNTDFRNWIKFELILQDRNIKDEEKFYKIINLIVKEPNQLITKLKTKKDYEKFVSFVMWFYSYSSKVDNKNSENKAVSKGKMIYSFEYDADYIFSSFYECYKIDLTTARLHWWKFKALLLGLNEDCYFSKILGYRSMVIDSKMSKEEKKFYIDKKKAFALPDLRSEEEKENAFANSLLNMG